MADEEEKPTLLEEVETSTDTLPPYKVILHNDDVNEFGYVVRTVYKITPLSKQEAYRKVLEAHASGASVLLICHKERAELYHDQLHSCGLTVTVEPD